MCRGDAFAQRQEKPFNTMRSSGQLLGKGNSNLQRNGKELGTWGRRRRRWGQGARAPQKNREKIFCRQLLCKIRAFRAKNRVTFGDFVNFSGNIIKIKVFSGKNRVKFGHLKISCIFFRAQMYAPPP